MNGFCDDCGLIVSADRLDPGPEWRTFDERKRKPFEGFDELSDRVAGLHRPKEVLVERILEELRDDDLKYRIFVGRDPDAAE